MKTFIYVDEWEMGNSFKKDQPLYQPPSYDDLPRDENGPKILSREERDRLRQALFIAEATKQDMKLRDELYRQLNDKTLLYASTFQVRLLLSSSATTVAKELSDLGYKVSMEEKKMHWSCNKNYTCTVPMIDVTSALSAILDPSSQINVYTVTVDVRIPSN